ncbi:MAG: hypothetical protein AAGJ40_22130 [Planctomycetota bacterium]
MPDANPTRKTLPDDQDPADRSTPTSSATTQPIRLARSKQVWTRAGSAAGFVLRYLPPMRRLLIDMVDDDGRADQAMAILIQHLVKTGYGEHDQHRLRDFLIRGIRSAAKVQATQANAKWVAEQKERWQESEAQGEPFIQQPEPQWPIHLELAATDSTQWIDYWRDGLLQRAWRALERQQHAIQFRLQSGTTEPDGNSTMHTDADGGDLVHDVLHVSMAHAGESTQVLAGRLASSAGRTINDRNLQQQLHEARILFAQFLADEVASTLDDPSPATVRSEIQTLRLHHAFSDVTVLE